MSFSGDIKREISRITDAEDYIQLAELIAILRYQDCIHTGSGGSVSIGLITENTALAKRMFVLTKDHVSAQPEFTITDKKTTGKARRCRIMITNPPDVRQILSDTGIAQGDVWKERAAVDAAARRAYIRGAFLSAGSVSDPGKSYHCEIICPDDPEHGRNGAGSAAGTACTTGDTNKDPQKNTNNTTNINKNTDKNTIEDTNKSGNAEADFLLEQLAAFEIGGKTAVRKGKTLVYIKESTAIVDLLNVIGAHQSLMQMENVRILKEMKNSANRQFNCDNANINKIVQTSGRQIDDIRLIEERVGIKSLPENLQQAAQARLAYPEISLAELGTMLDPPVGKSGVNHRLRKIAAIAEKLREENG